MFGFFFFLINKIQEKTQYTDFTIFNRFHLSEQKYVDHRTILEITTLQCMYYCVRWSRVTRHLRTRGEWMV